MTAGIVALIAVALYMTALGDASVAAVIAGVFTIVNTVLNSIQIRQHKQLERQMIYTHKILSAPRRAIHDNEGRVIGTMLKLEDEDDWARIAPAQRADDLTDLD